MKVVNPQIVSFLNPGYKVKRELSLSDTGQDIIYAGPYVRKIKEVLDSYTDNWISLSGNPDLDLSSNSSLLKWYAEKNNKRVSERVIEQVDTMDEDQFLYLFKIFTVMGRWVRDEEKEVTMFDLFKATSGGLKEFIQVGIDLMEIFPYPIVESSYFTFLQRVKSPDEQSVNPHYMRVIKSANQKISGKINKAVMQYSTRDNLRDELKLLSLQLGLR